MDSGINFTVKSQWEEPLEKDLEDILEIIKASFRLGASAVRGIAKDNLERRVVEDVYAQWVPEKYERRYEEGGLLDVDSGVDFKTDEYGNSTAFYVNVDMNYTPNGDQWQWKHPANGDVLISRIESGSGYEWFDHPGPRPYWTNFVKQMINSAGGFAEAGQRIADDLRAQEMQVEFSGVADVDANSNDGLYEQYF